MFHLSCPPHRAPGYFESSRRHPWQSANGNILIFLSQIHLWYLLKFRFTFYSQWPQFIGNSVSENFARFVATRVWIRNSIAH